MIDRFRALLEWEGSTRALGLMRIGLVVVAWGRWAAEVAPFSLPQGPEKLLLGASFYASTAMMLVGWQTRFATAWAGLTAMVMIYGFGVYGGYEPSTHLHTTLLAHALFLSWRGYNEAAFLLERARHHMMDQLRGGNTPQPDVYRLTEALTRFCDAWKQADESSEP